MDVFQVLHRVVSYSISTSNHNVLVRNRFIYRLYLIPFLHQTTTYEFYLTTINVLYLIPFLHQTTTIGVPVRNPGKLYLIPFLHQTTTSGRPRRLRLGCILFHFYIKPQLYIANLLTCMRCILFHFYIKPQLSDAYVDDLKVVSYSISTSNHNLKQKSIQTGFVVSYSISTSNHNAYMHYNYFDGLYLIPFLHQTTTYGA